MISQFGITCLKPCSIALATSSALKLSLNESGAITIFIKNPTAKWDKAGLNVEHLTQYHLLLGQQYPCANIGLYKIDLYKAVAHECVAMIRAYNTQISWAWSTPKG
ncbi:hypothetical protein TUM4641_24760 [Shewanella morhuae]|nr:hypothetical protein TUM4641_24760 [Shewanella morhuae]